MHIMNIAESIKEYYDHKDFKDNYAQVLFEMFHNDKDVIIERIKTCFNSDNYETREYFTNWKELDTNQAEKIHEFISENFEDFTHDFNGYYVGACSLQSVEFGEQEEQLTGLYNHKTGKPYTLKYLSKIFSDADYYVKGEYAYYDLNAGLHIKLLNSDLDEFLLTI